jgi:hypothetical protein
MVDLLSCHDVPSGVLDLLRIFLVASCRGESANITLETRKKEITSSYRTVNVTGSPATTNTENKKCERRPSQSPEIQDEVGTVHEEKRGDKETR